MKSRVLLISMSILLVFQICYGQNQITEKITIQELKEHDFLKEVDKTVKSSGFQNRTEFIRNALREKVEEVKLKQAMIALSKLKGKSSKKTTDEELERIREKAFEEIDKKLK